jgi:hypothetical protein
MRHARETGEPDPHAFVVGEVVGEGDAGCAVAVQSWNNQLELGGGQSRLNDAGAPLRPHVRVVVRGRSEE